MNWRNRRQALYIGSASLVILAILSYVAYGYFSTPGTCYDQIQDNGEQGIDCESSCARMCAAHVKDPKVLWQRALQVNSGVYTGVVYIKNPQGSSGVAAYQVSYTLRFRGENNHLIMETTGTIDLPAIMTIPVIVPNIPTGNQSVKSAEFAFTAQANNPDIKNGIVWTKIPAASRPTLTVKNLTNASDWSRISATIVNETNLPVKNLGVAAVLFDASGNAVAASRSLIQEISPEGSDDVVFTWPGANVGVVRAEITPLPSLPPNPQP